ncbi:MAG TPA: DoxX family protein [Chitinophagaceae bacterium]|nr:DoxX family protein [Chitinophagaceae bacterium]
MKKVRIIYWLFTGLLVALMLFSGIGGLLNPEQSMALITGHLGYPEYFNALISTVKLFGVVAILVPGFPRLKEWAYAGFTFDLGMAIYSFIAVGDPVTATWFMFLGLMLVFGSYIFYHRKRRLAAGGRVADAVVTEPEISMS